jgi:hypothetical protein
MRPLDTREQIGPGDIPELARMLDEGDDEKQCRALTLLCPCRNRVYSPELWSRVFRARGSGEFQVKDRAHHAILTLLDRAEVDPRSSILLASLEEELGPDTVVAAETIRRWGPRHRPSRRKRMTACRSGRRNALLFAERQERLIRNA